MSDLIRMRRGETIAVEEYPPGFMEALNERLNGSPEPEESWLDRAATWVFDNIADGPVFRAVILIAGVAGACTVVTQVARLL